MSAPTKPLRTSGDLLTNSRTPIGDKRLCRKASAEIRWRLSTNVKALRRARGYTQLELATICGFSKTYISNVEQGTVNISLANLEMLAVGLVCSEEDLLRRPSNPNPRADLFSESPRVVKQRAQKLQGGAK